MKFNIQSKLLLSHLSAVSKVVNSKNTISILDNFLFYLDGNQLIVTGSDQETSLTTRVEVSGAEGVGKFAANAKAMLDLLKQLPDIGLEFDIDDDNLEIVIKYVNGKYNFVGVNGNEFPQKAPSTEPTTEIVMPVKKLVCGIQQAIFAVSDDTLRPVMMGVFCDVTPDKVVFVATDLHKMVRFTENDVHTGVTASFILPTKPASIINSVFDKKDGDVKITVDSKGAVFTVDDYTLSCRFVNGRYPNYNSVIPADNPYSVTVDRQQLLNAARRVSVFASSGGQINLKLTSNEIIISSQDVDFSTSAEEHIQCDYNGADMIICFNNEHIIDVLSNIDDDTVIIKLMDAVRAGIFVPANQTEGNDLLVLLMPVML